MKGAKKCMGALRDAPPAASAARPLLQWQLVRRGGARR